MSIIFRINLSMLRNTFSITKKKCLCKYIIYNIINIIYFYYYLYYYLLFYLLLLSLLSLSLTLSYTAKVRNFSQTTKFIKNI